MAERTVLVPVPAHLYERLERSAEQHGRRVDDDVIAALAALVDEDDARSDLDNTLASMGMLSFDALKRLARSTLSEDDAARLAQLGDQGQRDGLAPTERWEAERLVERHDRIVLIRAEAAALLKQHGYQVDGLLTER